MKFKGTIIDQASGSVAGLTFSRGIGGQYIRARAMPTNPNSPYQQIVRGFMSQLTSLWNNTLTAVQRAAWDTYAANVTLIDPLGEPINVSGINHYIRSNVPRLQAALARVDDAPTIFNLGDYTNPDVTNATEAGGTFDVTFDTGDDWVGEDEAAMLVLSSRSKNPTINYFKGPYRFADSIDGDGTTPPTSPATITSPFAINAGTRLFAKMQVTRADGRLSAPFRDYTLAVS